jgi:hypothetical protein
MRMSEITLNTVRLYTEDDPYEVNTDNRPLVDIISNVELINTYLGNFGFYKEAAADPANTPVGGFTLNTCACIANNGLLEPIDITQSAAEFDYSKYPIVLVVDYNPTTAMYSCLTFSASYNINSKFPPFLATSVGNPIMVGLGGILVDSYYFNQYYSSSAYQNLIVGRISSVDTITFGGNQVGILGDNFFLGKDRDDSTTGLTTITRNNSESNVIFKSVNVDTVGCPYMFGEIQSAYIPSTSLNQLAVPLFFTNNTISYNQSTGTFLDADLNSKLNEIHFAGPTLSPSSSQDSIYNTAGVNIQSLTNFATKYLLHDAAFSNNLSEASQSISSNLLFTFQNSTQTTLATQFPSVLRSIGSAINQGTGIPNSLLPASSTTISGLTFDTYRGTGAYIGAIKDNPVGITRPTTADDTSLAQSTDFSTINMSDLANSCTLLIHAHSDDDTVLSNLMLAANGYVVLSGDYGVHYSPLATKDSEIANKAYVDSALASITNSSTQTIPLGGNAASSPITGQLYFDVTASAVSTSQVLQFNTVGTSDILSAYPVRFIDSSASPDPSGMMLLNFATSAASSSTATGWNGYEGVNKGFLQSYVSSVISGGNSNPYVSLAGSGGTGTVSQKITSPLEISNTLTLDDDLFFTSQATTIHFGNGSGDGTILFENISPAYTVKLETSSTIDGDSNSTLTTKDYVDNSVEVVTNTIPNIWASWQELPLTSGGIVANAAPTTHSTTFSSFIATTGSGFTAVKACNVRVKFNAFVNSTDYLLQVCLYQNGNIISTTGCGNTTTAAGVSMGYYTMNIDTIVSCEQNDILYFTVAQNYAVKSTGALTTFNTSGYMMVLK